MTLGGEGPCGMLHSLETKLKISKSLLGNKRSLGCVQSSESNIKRSQTLKGKKKPRIKGTRKFELISPNGEVISTINLPASCRERGLDPSYMYRIASGKYKSYKGGSCRTIKPLPMEILCVDTCAAWLSCRTRRTLDKPTTGATPGDSSGCTFPCREFDSHSDRRP